MKRIFSKIKERLGKMSYRSGIIVLASCVPCYIISFAQMLLPTDAATKGILWVVFFGLAKTLQYSGIAILGTETVRRLLHRKKRT